MQLRKVYVERAHGADDHLCQQGGAIGEEERIQSTPEFRALLVKFGMDPSPPNTPEQFAAIVKNDVERWARAVAASGAVVD